MTLSQEVHQFRSACQRLIATAAMNNQTLTEGEANKNGQPDQCACGG